MDLAGCVIVAVTREQRSFVGVRLVTFVQIAKYIALFFIDMLPVQIYRCVYVYLSLTIQMPCRWLLERQRKKEETQSASMEQQSGKHHTDIIDS